MKVINSIKSIYTNQEVINNTLKLKVDSIFESSKLKSWHYISRTKPLESFAQKIETGRVEDPSKMEDFFACTFVVENMGQIPLAVTKVEEHANILYQRPKTPEFTHKDTSSFVFDDLRLYCQLKETNSREKGPVNDIIFEVQIKTFLQHAWAISTRELIYKSDVIDWQKQRIAYQIKAMLENAEISIGNATQIEEVRGLPTNNRKIKKQNLIKSFIHANWPPERLPENEMRLVDNIEQLTSQFHIEIKDLQILLNEEAKEGKGYNSLNLSPYLAIIQTLINKESIAFVNFLRIKRKRNYPKKILIPSKELDFTYIDYKLFEKSDNIILI
ncbi:hypothetical protein [Winogradskyella sp.]|jgi:hypothetical protein|uniref:hypothetical protein n=1 Tax=Winogradskyella sp. TaxID=1883156 RepID=UPI0025D7ECDF|nr:hypothetical protein [Winogradskyella sp.]MCT4629060.1 hypothetical protein [Winogradskyella sp.]